MDTLTLHSRLPTVWENPPRPQRIGLALAGGAARGMAHVGVLQALDAHNIPIHAIAGTSAGALVGGLYAAGVSGQRLLDVRRGLKWSSISGIGLKSLSLSRLSLSNVGLPLGLLDLDKLIEWIHGVLGGPVEFSQLNIPFAAVASDIVRGEAVVMNEGDIALAIRASSTVPGVFTPVRRNGRLLVDGVVVNNLPISVVREMGADYIIAVELVPPAGQRDREPANALEMMMMSTYAMIRATQHELMPPDCLIEPAIGHISMMDMGKSDELVELGRVATEALIPQIKRDLGLADHPPTVLDGTVLDGTVVDGTVLGGEMVDLATSA